MESKQTHEELTEILNRNTSWIENCDSKSSIILGVMGVIISVFLATDNVSKFADIYRYMVENINFGSVLYLVLSFLSLLAIFIGGLFLFRVLIARINPNEFEDKGIKSDSLIFFSTIAKNKSLGKYKEKLNQCTSAEMNNDLVSQIYICSLICEKKFRFYKIGLITSLSGFMVFVIMVGIGVLIL